MKRRDFFLSAIVAAVTALTASRKRRNDDLSPLYKIHRYTEDGICREWYEPIPLGPNCFKTGGHYASYLANPFLSEEQKKEIEMSFGLKTGCYLHLGSVQHVQNV